MTAIDFLRQLVSRGVCVTPRGEKLVVDAPVGVLGAQDRELLLRYKEHLLRLLVRATPADLPPEWHVLWDERAAIMEYDGGLPREHAEALALAQILCQMQAGS